MAWWIDNAEKRASRHATFRIPDEKVRRKLRPGDIAKLLFSTDDIPPAGRFGGATGERMWVYIRRVTDDGYVGELNSKPCFISGLQLLDEVVFGPEHILDIDRVTCVDCELVTPDFEQESELDDKGWGGRPHPQEPRITLRLCPSCTTPPN